MEWVFHELSMKHEMVSSEDDGIAIEGCENFQSIKEMKEGMVLQQIEDDTLTLEGLTKGPSPMRLLLNGPTVRKITVSPGSF